MVPAIRAQLPAPWQYNLENCKSQDMLDRKLEIVRKSASLPTHMGNRAFIKAISVAVLDDPGKLPCRIGFELKSADALNLSLINHLQAS